MSNNAPINVLLETPTIIPDGWNDEAQKWQTLNKEIGGHPDFYPLTIKAAYVIGVIHTLCESVSILLADSERRHTTYIPAYGVFASGIELLGRCLRGNTTTGNNSADLNAGFKWLAASYFNQYSNDYESVPDRLVLIQTQKHMYSIKNLVALRHFAAHGQATSKVVVAGAYEFGYIDYEILSHMPHLLSSGLEKFLGELKSSEERCNKLACSSVIALRKWPVFLSWSSFEADREGVYRSIGELFLKFNW